MLVEELVENGKRIRHYSDSNKYILQVETQLEYIDAVDIIPCRYTYLETDKEIEDK